MTLHPLPITLLAATLALYAGVANADANPDASDEPTASVQAVATRQGPVSSVLRGYGVLGTSAALTQSVSLPYLARVERIRASAGQVVKRGAPLLEVSADPAAVLAAAQARSSVDAARGELARVKSQYDLRLATTSQLAVAQKAVSDAQEAYNAQQETGAKPGKIVVTAPHDGTVLQITAAQGDQVAAGTAMLQLALRSDGKTQANTFFGIEPADAGKLHPGDPVTLNTVGSNLQGSASGVLVSIGQAIDPTSQLVTVGVSVVLANTNLLPGMHVTADVRTQPQTLWQVPEAAVLGHPEPFLYQIKDGHARKVPVKVLADDGSQLGVTGDLDPAEQVVTVGAPQLADGMAVELAKDAAQ